MGEDYTKLSKEELIEKLKSKDKQIAEMSKKYDAMQHELINEIDNLKQKNNDIEKAYWNYRKETQEIRNLEFENNSLKDTIIAMAMYCFPGVAHIDRNIIDIKTMLKNINKGR